MAAKEKLNGYWDRKGDPGEYVVITRVYKKGVATGFRYFIRDGREVIDINPFKIDIEDLKKLYEKRE